MRCSQRECHPVHEVKFSCEENDCAASGPSATSKSQENINNCEVIEVINKLCYYYIIIYVKINFINNNN